MKFKTLDLVQGSPEWLAARLSKITASQVPVLFGVSPYQTRLELFEEKYFGIEPKTDSFKERLFERGHEAEELAREWILNKTGIRFIPTVLESLEVPGLMASLDGWNEATGLILEVKYVGEKALKSASEGVIPDHHLLQVQAQILVSGAPRAYYVCVNEKSDATMIDVLPDERMHDDIKKAAADFLDRLRTGEAPEAGDKDWYEPTGDDNFRKLKEIMRARDEIEATYEQLKAQIVKTYKNYRRVKSLGVHVSRYTRRGNVKCAAIPELKGVNLDAYRGKSVDVVKVEVKQETKASNENASIQGAELRH